MKYKLLGDDVHFLRIEKHLSTRRFVLRFGSIDKLGYAPKREYSIHDTLTVDGPHGVEQIHPLEIPGIKTVPYMRGQINVEILSTWGGLVTYRIKDGKWVF